MYSIRSEFGSSSILKASLVASTILSRGTFDLIVSNCSCVSPNSSNLESLMSLETLTQLSVCICMTLQSVMGYNPPLSGGYKEKPAEGLPPETSGFGPSTPRLRGVCSTRLSYAGTVGTRVRWTLNPCSFGRVFRIAEAGSRIKRGSPSMVKGVGLRLLSLRGSWVQIPPPAPNFCVSKGLSAATTTQSQENLHQAQSNQQNDRTCHTMRFGP